MQYLQTALIVVAAAGPSLADTDWSVVKGTGAPHGISTADWNSAMDHPNLTASYRFDGPDISAAFPPSNDSAWTAAPFDLSVNVAAQIHTTRNDKRRLQQLSYRLRSRDEDDDDDDDDDDDKNNKNRNRDYFTGSSINLKKFDGPQTVDAGWKLCVNIFLPRLSRVATSGSQDDSGDCGAFLSAECRQALLDTSSTQFASCGVADLPSACKDVIENDKDEVFGFSTDIGSGSQIFAYGSQTYNWGRKDNDNDDWRGGGEYAVAHRMIWPVMLTWGGSGDAAESRASLHCVRAKDVVSGSAVPQNLSEEEEEDDDDDDNDDDDNDDDDDNRNHNAAGLKMPFAGWALALAAHVALAMLLCC
ncbi:hypothetical protein CORC01_01057 [Colletotrichum orchidophilum]|uniref:Uncharacterized protein n=1 Tax=Colletotrichum orchidophilum TaxID=1209926 RepID=A0A1G4BQY2_9PEZI|nr:uncharacterized protein CORC01_01057 [Colletotrichum orchidophilum]OHF03738.1 hypothetical protein CORC01_01057 [Colletotrichum orchidophilum]